jgi:hypothetical protein
MKHYFICELVLKLPGKMLDQDFPGWRVAQEVVWASRIAIGAGLEYDHEISHLCSRQRHFVCQYIQGCTQGAHNTDGLQFFGCYPVADADRVILANDLAEVTRGRQVMMQPAVGDQEGLAPGGFAINDLADINAGFSGQISAQFHDNLCIWQHDSGFFQIFREILCDRGKFQGLIPGELLTTPGMGLALIA